MFLWGVMQRRRVSIILYHDPPAEIFEKHINILKKWYNIISLNEFISAYESGQLKNLPKWPLVITIDDGHVKNFSLTKIISRENIFITIFLCTGIIGTCRRFWFRSLPKNLSSKSLKTVSNAERKRILAEHGFDENVEHEDRQALSDEEIRAMAGIVDFQAHSAFHPCLPMCDDDEAQREICHSRDTLAHRFGIDASAFAYPNGDFVPRDCQLVEKAGYRCGLTTLPGYNTAENDRFQLRRNGIYDHAGKNELLVQASGMWAYIWRWIGRG